MALSTRVAEAPVVVAARPVVAHPHPLHHHANAVRLVLAVPQAHAATAEVVQSQAQEYETLEVMPEEAIKVRGGDPKSCGRRGGGGARVCSSSVQHMHLDLAAP